MNALKVKEALVQLDGILWREYGIRNPRLLSEKEDQERIEWLMREVHIYRARNRLARKLAATEVTA